MNKKIFSAILILSLAISVFAYNPPNQGENLFSYGSPSQITYGNSTAGGGIPFITPSVTVFNPALGALEDRTVLDLGYTGIISSVDSNSYGQAFALGALVPTKWAVFTAEIFGSFVPFERMQLGNSFTLKSSASKQVTEHLYIGAGIGGGITFSYGTDWSLTADVGALYAFGDWGFLKDIRLAASVLNIGKTFNNTTTIGINGDNSKSSWLGYPSFTTLRAGVAAKFVETENFTLGMSTDFTTTFFTNIILDAGLQMDIAKIIRVGTSWQCDFQQINKDYYNWIPTVGIAVHFNIDSGKNSYMKNNGWEKSEVAISSSWKNIDNNKNAISLGGVITLGTQEAAAPVIEILDEE